MSRFGRTYTNPVITRTALVAGGTTYDKTGGGVVGVVGSGADANTWTEAGGAFVPVVGSGADATSYDETGGGVVAVVGSGTATVQHPPPAPTDTGGGGDGRIPAGTAGRPYLRLEPIPKPPEPPKPRAKPSPDLPKRLAERGLRPFEFSPVGELSVPQILVPSRPVEPDLAPDVPYGDGEDEEMAAAYSILLLI